MTCAQCESLTAYPAPSEDHLRLLYSPLYQSTYYSEANAADPDLALELEATADAVASLRPGGLLLDVGCGSGAFLAACKRRSVQAVGFELVKETAERTEFLTGHRVHHTSTSSITGGQFDIVHMADVLEHLPDPESLLTEASRLLRPEGILVARGPLEAQVSLFLMAVKQQRHVRNWLGRRPSVVEVPPYHLIQFTLSGWHYLLWRAGFRVQTSTVSETTWPAPTTGWSAKRLLKRLSLHVSESGLGRTLALGNRVTTVAVRA